jgi:hypothetical protein
VSAGHGIEEPNVAGTRIATSAALALRVGDQRKRGPVVVGS